MVTGTVKWFNGEKGYGFITPDDNGNDLFVHFSSIIGEGYRTLQEGEQVDFEASEGRKGPEAINVRSRGGGSGAPPPSYDRPGQGGGRRW